MEQQGLRTGHLIALCGAVAALTSLWRPWYSVDLPPAFRDALSGEASQAPGALGQIAQGLISALPSRIQASGWRELQGADVALCVGALAIVVLMLGAAGAFGGAVRIDRAAAGRISGALGAAGTVLVGWHVAVKPGAGAPGADMVKLGGGIWIALAGCVVTTIGGLMAAIPEKPVPFSPAPPPAFGGPGSAAEPAQQALSVGPPSSRPPGAGLAG
ncbi:MAG: hypothetical protein QOH43_640 [Solirubrobacteraceae bacterium]|jgi:hypothetical protein|nr:hypothetical protein [Solirubrobacteraceae bacterium]